MPDAADDASATQPRSPSLIAPESVRLLHEWLTAKLANYNDWLASDATWKDRPEQVRQKRAAALEYLGDLTGHLDAWKLAYPIDVLLSRQEAAQFDAEDGADIREFQQTLIEGLALVDEYVHEAPPPPRTFDRFMGDPNRTYHTGTPGDPIPIMFYKNPEEDYEPIRVRVRGKKKARVESHDFPHGPTVQGRRGTYSLEVDPSRVPAKGETIVNTKQAGDPPSIRATQVDINHALAQAGADMTDKDGDHVLDLGFGGTDTADNYWPLKAHINRRPFHGWRALYGINYKDSAGNLQTAALAALVNKTFKIKGFMKASEDRVPAEGMLPDPKSGTDQV